MKPKDNRGGWSRQALLALLALGCACTDTNIYQQTREPNIPDRVTLSGTACTDDASQRQFPVRLMFIVDASGTPDPQRKFAVKNIVDKYIRLPGETYKFAIIKFAGKTQQLTSGYTKNQIELNTAIDQLATFGACENGCRNWADALSLANSVYTGDLLTSNPGTRSRTRYVFIFVVNGPPDPPLPTQDGCDERCRLVRMVEDMVDYGVDHGAAEVAFHGVQVDGCPGTCDDGSDTPPMCSHALPCRANCVGTEECQRAQRLCSLDRSQACSDGKGYCAALGLEDCTPEYFCTGDYFTPCDGNAICGGAGPCAYLKVCNNDVAKDCIRTEDCCPTFPCQFPDPAVCDPADDDRASELLTSMTFKGRGEYLRFPIVAKLNFEALDYQTTESVFVKKAFMVSNLNARALNGKILADSDGDGMGDREELCYGEILSGKCRDLESCDCQPDIWSATNPLGTDTDPARADTDGDGLNDMLETQFATLNLDPLRTDLPQACYGLEFPYKDRDADTLNDCEEKLLGTDTSLFDSDRDGYPDQVEFRAGTNYLEADNLKDLDMDGLPNGDEIELHLDPQSNDVVARSGEAYRYKVLDEGMRLVPFASQPNKLVGALEITDVSGRSKNGTGTLYYYPSGTRREDGTVRANPSLAWKDPTDGTPGREVEITGSGTYLLYSACNCVKDCSPPCDASAGMWCNPNTGVCAPDQCEHITCAATDRCDPLTGRCFADCSLTECEDGQRCDTLLGRCLTDCCLNITCPGGQDCDPEAGACTQAPCDGWTCPAGYRLNKDQKPLWITVTIDESLLPLSGFWCDGAGVTEAIYCTTDADCPVNTFCRIAEPIAVGVANKNCISFKVKNVRLVETLETRAGFGAGLNKIFVYFAQTPLDNPRAYSVFREALVQVRFLNGVKDPNWAEIPLGDGDFYPIEEK